MKFIVDTQLPFKLSMWLRRQGYDTIHTTDTQQGHLLADTEILAISVTGERTVITKDADFRDHYRRVGAPPRVLYLTFGNISNSDLLTYFEEYLPTLMDLYAEGAEFIEFNRRGIFID